MTTGEKIAALRREQGLSQEALADKLGLSRQAVSKWEADQAVPGMDNLVELAKLFGVTVDALLRPNEPFPGKEQQDSSEEQEAVVTPAGFSVSDQPQLTKKTKWVIGGLALLFAVSAICSVVSLVWVARLQEQVDSLPLGGGTVYVPSEPQPSFTSGDIAGFTEQCDYDGASGKLCFTFQIVPVERDEAETAQVMLKGNGTTESADAAWVDGAYNASVRIGLEDSYQAFLLLTKDGKTRSLPVTEYFDMRSQYALTIEGMEAEGGDRQDDRIGESTFILKIAIPDGGGNYPVSGTATMIAGETKLGAVALDNMGYQSDMEEMTSATLYCRAAFPAYEIPVGARSIRFDVTVKDAYGLDLSDSFDWQTW